MFFNQISNQNEINFHNLTFIAEKRADITISFLNYSADMNLYIIIITITLFIIGYGSFFPYLKRFNFLFLEKEFAIYSFIFAINTILNSILLKVFNSSLIFLNQELCELFIYFILMEDIFLKKKIFNDHLLGKKLLERNKKIN